MISVIIPTYNEQKFISQLLKSVLASSDAEIEVIVVDGGSLDGTLNIVKSYTQVKIVESIKGRAAQMNRGATISKGDLLFFVHADSQLPLGWKDHISSVFNDQSYVAGTFQLKFDQPGFWFGIYGLLSRMQGPLFTYGDQGLFVRKDVFDQIGGYPNLPIMEDYEILKRLNKSGGVTKLSTAITTSSRKFVQNGVVRQQLKNVMIVTLYILGFSPVKLSKWYSD